MKQEIVIALFAHVSPLTPSVRSGKKSFRNQRIIIVRTVTCQHKVSVKGVQCVLFPGMPHAFLMCRSSSNSGRRLRPDIRLSVTGVAAGICTELLKRGLRHSSCEGGWETLEIPEAQHSVHKEERTSVGGKRPERVLYGRSSAER